MMVIPGAGGLSMKLKMMVVDDSDAFREIMRELLIRVGFDIVIEAKDYSEAVENFKNEKPDVIFIDMILPDRSGVETTKSILEVNPKAIVIAMSAMINKKLIKEALAAGAKDFLFKPTNEMALNTVIQMWGGE